MIHGTTQVHKDTRQDTDYDAQKPSVLAVQVDDIPESLKALPQWVCWNLDWVNDKWTKVPKNPRTGGNASVTEQDSWADFASAHAGMLTYSYAGIGFVFTQDDRYAGIDLDNCRDPVTGQIAVWARDLILGVESYTEVSPSRTGVKIFVQGTLPDDGRRRSGDIEMYNGRRFFTVTGHHIHETPRTVEDRHDALNVLYRQVFASTDAVRQPLPRNRVAGAAADDRTVILRAMNAKNGAEFTALWNGDTTRYEGDDSKADYHLCDLLAFWVGPDPARIDQLFRQSRLYRPKWDRPDYRDRTITAVLDKRTAYYTPDLATLTVLPTGLRSTDPVDVTTPLDKSPSEILDLFLTQQEQGDADLLTYLYTGRLISASGAKEWYAWDTHHWKSVSQDYVRLLITTQVARQYLLQAGEYYSQAAQATDTTRQGALTATAEAHAKRSKALKTYRRADSVMRLAAGRVERDKTWMWDSTPGLLGVTNGVIDLTTGLLRAGQPEDRILTVAPVTYHGMDYSAPLWEKTLGQIFEDQPAMVSFLQRILGHGLMGQPTEHILPILWGQKGRNGKDTILETLLHVLGAYAQPVSRDVFLGSRHDDEGANGAAQPHIMHLRGKRLVWFAESGQGGKLNAGQVKQLTGGNTITARALYREAETFTATHLPLLLTNYKPAAPADDQALWERIILVTFNMRFVDTPTKENERKRMRGMADRLQTESSGVLAWLVRGCLEWQHKGLQRPTGVTKATEEYREEVDLLGQFLAACTSDDPAGEVLSTTLYLAFASWLRNTQGFVRPPTQATFGTQIKQKLQCRRKEGGIVYLGIRLQDPSHIEVEYIHRTPSGE